MKKLTNLDMTSLDTCRKILLGDKRYQQIDSLVRHKYPLAYWQGSSWAVGDNSNQKLLNEVNDYDKSLQQKSEDELRSMIHSINQEIVDNRDKEYDELPEADCEHYAKMKTWSIQEFFALLFEKNPKEFPHDRILGMSTHPFPSHVEIRYQKMWELISRDHNFGDTYSTPQKYIDWADSVGIDIPKALLTAVETQKNEILTKQGLREQLHSLINNVEGISLTALIKADCLSRSTRYALLVLQNFWVPCKEGKREQPLNSEVLEWLAERGIKGASADSILSTIRPEWASKGRPSVK